jgi:SAM-dependent methyltransferase
MPALLALHQRERMLLAKLGATCEKDLHELDILDVGCGSGGDLVRLVGHDADPARMHGIDLRAEVIATARQRLPSVDLRVANAAELPHPDRSMDLILQSTVLSSILDAGLRRRIAAEMMRVIRPHRVLRLLDQPAEPRHARGVEARAPRVVPLPPRPRPVRHPDAAHRAAGGAAIVPPRGGASGGARASHPHHGFHQRATRRPTRVLIAPARSFQRERGT